MRSLFKYLILLFSPLLLAQNAAQLDSLILKGIDARSNKEYQLSLEILTKVRTSAEERHLYKQHFLALNNIGANYYSMLDYGEALDNYLEAYTIALKHLDGNEEMTVLNNIAILYSKESDYAKAEDYFLKAYKLAKEYKNDRRIGLYAVNLGIVANQQDKLDEASNYLEEAKEILISDSTLILLVDIAGVENKYKRGELENAKYLGEKILPKLEITTLSEERLSLLILMSKIVKDIGDLPASIEYANKALRATDNPENRLFAYQQLAKIYQEIHLYDNALQAKDSVISLTESVNNLKNGKLYENNRVKFEIAEYQRELKQSKELRVKERNTLYMLLGLSLFIILLIAWALRNSYIRNKQRKTLHERSQEIIELELQKEKSDNLVLEKQINANEAMALLEEERLKNEIENRNRKLATKALQTSSRNDLLKEVIDRLSEQTEISRNVFLSKKIKELKSLLKGDGEWESFLTHFEEINHGILTALKKKHPELTANDIRYLSYLYMDLSNKEISSLFNITAEASRKRKERIKSKIGLNEDEDLYQYISSI